MTLIKYQNNFVYILTFFVYRAWGGNTFNYDNRLSNPQDGPIRNGTLILADPSDNRVIKEAGRSM